MQRVLLVAVGGAVGSVLRYLTTLLAVRSFGPDFPWGTLAVNLVGSFLIGLVNEVAVDALRVSGETRIMLVTGVLGGFTTYSAFSYEAASFLGAQAWSTAALYVVVTTVACVTLCMLGIAAGRSLAG
jgi:CrcB protein